MKHVEYPYCCAPDSENMNWESRSITWIDKLYGVAIYGMWQFHVWTLELSKRHWEKYSSGNVEHRIHSREQSTS